MLQDQDVSDFRSLVADDRPSTLDRKDPRISCGGLGAFAVQSTTGRTFSARAAAFRGGGRVSRTVGSGHGGSACRIVSALVAISSAIVRSATSTSLLRAAESSSVVTRCQAGAGTG